MSFRSPWPLAAASKLGTQMSQQAWLIPPPPHGTHITIEASCLPPLLIRLRNCWTTLELSPHLHVMYPWSIALHFLYYTSICSITWVCHAPARLFTLVCHAPARLFPFIPQLVALGWHARRTSLQLVSPLLKGLECSVESNCHCLAGSD